MSILQRCPLRESLLYLLTWTNTSLASLKVRFTHTFEVSSGYVVLVLWKGEREGIGAMSYRDVHDFCTVTELRQRVEFNVCVSVQCAIDGPHGQRCTLFLYWNRIKENVYCEFPTKEKMLVKNIDINGYLFLVQPPAPVCDWYKLVHISVKEKHWKELKRDIRW